jgi:Restriction Endonuclease associating with ARP
MQWAGALRQELYIRNQKIATQKGSVHELTAGELPSVIFGRDEALRHGNFHPASYRNICANPGWARRLRKVHTAWRRAGSRSGWRWMELDCANSSDALLMNIFCYRRTLHNLALSSLLGVSAELVPVFGFKPGIPLHKGRTDRTEIDMQVGTLLVEAKLTETNFQTAPEKLIARYRDVDSVFDLGDLPRCDGAFACYQLIRGVLAAHATGGSFCVLCDARRPDLVEKWYSVIRAVRCCGLRPRLQLLTWQELAACADRPLQNFLGAKYGILPSR